jgi:hypothetical protein
MGIFAAFFRPLWASFGITSRTPSSTNRARAHSAPLAALPTPLPSAGAPGCLPAFSTSPIGRRFPSIACAHPCARLIHTGVGQSLSLSPSTPATGTPSVLADPVPVVSRKTPRLRVVQHVNPTPTGPATSTTVRLTMSGTLADICAELDRLTQLEQSATYPDLKNPRTLPRRPSASMIAA